MEMPYLEQKARKLVRFTELRDDISTTERMILCFFVAHWQGAYAARKVKAVLEALHDAEFADGEIEAALQNLTKIGPLRARKSLAATVYEIDL